MANIREIKTRMNSIEDTLKITNAMYLISSSKLKKARKQLDATTPYFEMLQASLLDIMAHTPDLQHIFLNKRKKEQIESDICHITTREDTLIHLLTHRQGIVSYKIRIIV